MATDENFKIEIYDFHKGLAPLAHIDGQTFIGDRGQASDMLADIISKPGYLTQSPGLVDLTNGNQGGAVSELIRFILDQPTSSNITYGLGVTKLFKITPTAVASGGSPSWPQTVNTMAEGESLVRLNNNLLGFYNKSSDGDIFSMPLDTEVIDNDWGSTNDQALEKAPHPVATKEDVVVFGNGRYLGVYVEGASTLDVRKLDFGKGSEVADVVFHMNHWWIAVNYGDRKSQVYMYDGSALSNILTDEAAVGPQKIGFLYVVNGIIYIAFTDNTSGGYSIGYLNGRVLEPLRYFTGSLPSHRQKSLYKNTVVFVSGEYLWSFGASVSQLPAQISRFAEAGYDNVGAVASPFGSLFVSSSDGSSSHRIAKLSGYSINGFWNGLVIDLTSGSSKGKITKIIVYTKRLADGARATLKLQANQDDSSSESTKVVGEIQGVDKTVHIFKSIGFNALSEVKLIISSESGDVENDCPIRKIVILGNLVEG